MQNALLWVDDEPETPAEVMNLLRKKANYDVEIASTIGAAFEKLKTKSLKNSLI